MPCTECPASPVDAPAVHFNFGGKWKSLYINLIEFVEVRALAGSGRKLYTSVFIQCIVLRIRSMYSTAYSFSVYYYDDEQCTQCTTQNLINTCVMRKQPSVSASDRHRDIRTLVASQLNDLLCDRRTRRCLTRTACRRSACR